MRWEPCMGGRLLVDKILKTCFTFPRIAKIVCAFC
jgi:hypothetical protein